nr:MAG TPA: hypothetical protein [Caudoviricetes sp.]
MFLRRAQALLHEGGTKYVDNCLYKILTITFYFTLKSNTYKTVEN